MAGICRHYSLVFRDQRDQGKERKLPTPAPEELLPNLYNFLTKWGSANDASGSNVINTKVKKEIINIECHIRKTEMLVRQSPGMWDNIQ